MLMIEVIPRQWLHLLSLLLVIQPLQRQVPHKLLPSHFGKVSSSSYPALRILSYDPLSFLIATGLALMGLKSLFLNSLG